MAQAAVLGEGTRQRKKPQNPTGTASATFYNDVNPVLLNDFLDRHPDAKVNEDLSGHGFKVYNYPIAEYVAEQKANEARATAMIQPEGVSQTDEVKIKDDGMTLEAHMAQSEADAHATAERRKELESAGNPFDK